MSNRIACHLCGTWQLQLSAMGITTTTASWGDYSVSIPAISTVAEGLRQIETWTARHGVAVADWPAEPVDPFFNVNTPEDAARAQALASRLPELQPSKDA
jgi:hypothetical protein